MININDKDGALCIHITGSTIKNSFIISQIVEELAKSDDLFANSIMLGISKVKDKDFIMECVDRANRAKEKTDEMFADENINGLNDLLNKIKQIIKTGEDEDE